MRRARRLFWQLFPTYLAITLLALLAFGGYASRSMRGFYLEQAAADLEARGRLLLEPVLGYVTTGDFTALQEWCRKKARQSAMRVTVILPAGRVVADSHSPLESLDNHGNRPEIREALAGREGVARRLSRSLGLGMLYVGLPVFRKDTVVAVVRTALPLDALESSLGNLHLKFAFGGLGIACLAAVVSLWISRRITRPIEEIRRWAASFPETPALFQAPENASEEMEDLARSLREMAAQLQERIQALSEQRNEMEAVLSSMGEGVIAVDTQERVLQMNEAAGKMLGCRPAAVHGRSLQEAVRNTVLHRFVKKAMESRDPVEEDVVLRGNGERHVASHGTLLKDGGGRQLGVIVVLNDVTRLRRLEKMRREFVANVSHEIKTPITAIKGFVETLRSGGLENSQDAQRFLEIVDKHARRLESIVEDLLQLSRIEQQEEDHALAFSSERLQEVLRSAVNLCRHAAAKRRIEVRLDCTEALTARMNPILLEQAVVNLLDNAIKYSEPGGKIGIQGSQCEGEVTIQVRDEGCGIAKENLPRLFERFYRVDRGRSRRQGGTGLGLAIVKHIMEAHGGRVGVESELGSGSTFTLHLPGPPAAR